MQNRSGDPAQGGGRPSSLARQIGTAQPKANAARGCHPINVQGNRQADWRHAAAIKSESTMPMATPTRTAATATAAEPAKAFISDMATSPSSAGHHAGHAQHRVRLPDLQCKRNECRIQFVTARLPQGGCEIGELLCACRNDPVTRTEVRNGPARSAVSTTCETDQWPRRPGPVAMGECVIQARPVIALLNMTQCPVRTLHA